MIAQRHLLVAGMFLLAMLLYVDRICISTAKEPIAERLQLSDEQFGWVMSAFALGYALFQAPMGLVADRFGPRWTLGSVVTLWSGFTGLTAAVTSLPMMLLVRFLFGAGEAGAFPGAARASYSWIPMPERGTVQGVIFAGGRLGGAFALPACAALVQKFGWRETFIALMLVGFAWAVAWLLWFRDDPAQHPTISPTERELILNTRQQAIAGTPDSANLTTAAVLGSANMGLLMAQYFASNFTFFFCLSWMFPHLKKTYSLDAITAAWYAAVPFLFGALGNVVAGALVDRIFRQGKWTASRRFPAALGFILAAGGMVACGFADSINTAVLFLAIAVFGADMTLAPSWAVCVDIGRRYAGTVSGTMNMAGNLGSFVTSLAFAYLLTWTGTHHVFFYVAAGLNLVAAALWLFIRPQQPLVSSSLTP
jgi:ACS family glucarate transporter-like MFS transporter